MNTIFDSSDYETIRKRFENFTPGAQRQWGKMDPAQMLAHVNVTLQTALGEIIIKRLFIGYIFGPLAKKSYVGPDPMKPNGPTAKEFIITDSRDFEKEKQKLLVLVKRLHEGGEENVTRNPHGFFGKLTPQEWGITQWKHMDHHLRQFGS